MTLLPSRMQSTYCVVRETVELPGCGKFLVRPYSSLGSDAEVLFRRPANNDTEKSKPSAPAGLIPTTVIDCSAAPCTAGLLGSIVTAFEKDEEYSRIFLQSVVLLSSSSTGPVNLDDDLRGLLQSWNCRMCYSVPKPPGESIPAGPFFLKDRILHWAWLLYDDVFDAFHIAAIQQAKDHFAYETVNRTNSDGHLQIAVPSRLHYKRSPSKPLNGLRIAVKDILDVRGLKTSGQSRSYNALYPPRSRSAFSVQKLLELGAVVVGKVKGTQFASSEQPTADWVETLCPFNPRGDGYLNPRGSSTGSGVAVAGYEWLDCSIGSDTSGSMRGPAAVMGNFANRPTWGLMNLDGMLVCSEEIDTVALTTRDVDVFHRINALWYDLPESAAKVSRPKRLIFEDDFLPYDNPAAQKVMESFVGKMANFLGVSVERPNLADQWAKDDPAGDGIPLKEFVVPIMNTLIWSGYWRNHHQFRKDYHEKFGAPPYVGPVIRYAWERGAQITDSEITEVKKRQSIYGKWMEEKVLHSTGDGTLDVIIMYPVGDAGPVYRDNFRLPPEKLSGYNWRDKEDHQACLAGVPALSIPIGQTTYESRVTRKTEWAPVSIGIMAARNTDHALTQLVKDMMIEAGYPSSVKAGREAYEVKGS